MLKLKKKKYEVNKVSRKKEIKTFTVANKIKIVTVKS